MFDDFFIRALIAGIGVSIVAGPLGCMVVWRRLSYFGDTLSHSALLGVTIAYSFSINISLSVFIVSGVIALLLLSLQKRTQLPGDALLGLLSHSTLAVGLVIIGLLSSIRFDLMGLLFGDILAVTIEDIFIIWFGGLIILGILFFIWKSLFAATVSYDLAAAEGMKPDVSNFIFTILLAGVIAISIKMIGVLLITGLLLIPAAMARNISNNPLQMIIFSVFGGILSVIIGLFSSLEFNTASGPSIIVAALILFVLSLLPLRRNSALQK
jgi:zinc transport system permease protein